jgi:hypothetical protein
MGPERSGPKITCNANYKTILSSERAPQYRINKFSDQEKKPSHGPQMKARNQDVSRQRARAPNFRITKSLAQERRKDLVMGPTTGPETKTYSSIDRRRQNKLNWRIYISQRSISGLRLRYSDIGKKFDTTWHHGLLIKLSKLEFSTSVIKLIGSFLTDRKFRLDGRRNVYTKVCASHRVPPRLPHYTTCT